MTDLKLPKLPDRTPVKLTIGLLPDLNQRLSQYADAYEATYGQREAIADLIPHMLASFLDTDRGFARFLANGGS
jgi:hypothetical protein